MSSVLHDVAPILGPPPPAPAAVAAMTSPWWTGRPAVTPAMRSVVWGSPALPSGTPGKQIVYAAWRRRGAVRRVQRHPPPGLAVRAVHHVDPPALGTGRRARLRALLLRGVLVELVPDVTQPRVLDAVARAAGALEPVGAIVIGSGGTVLARVRLPDGPAVLRVGRQGTTGDPARCVAPLRMLCEHDLVPRLAGSGMLSGASWTAEELLPGSRPSRLTPDLVAQVARFCADLPRSGAPASAEPDFEVLKRRLPLLSPSLRRAEAVVGRTLAGLPAVGRHGDLWSGNLLVRNGRLTGILDWDAWSTAGVPGTDVLHLLATQNRLANRRSLGDVFLDRPWEWDAYAAATAHYWPHLGIRPTPALGAAISVAWWAAQVGADLRRNPGLEQGGPWLTRNVLQVLEAVERDL